MKLMAYCFMLLETNKQKLEDSLSEGRELEQILFLF